MHAWIDVLARPCGESLLPSNITDWVVLICPCASAFIDAPITLRERPGNAVFFLRSTTSTGPLYLLVGARVHYLLSCCLHLQKYSNIHYFCAAHVTNLGVPGWAPAEMTQVARSVDVVPPRLQPESSSVVVGK